MMEQKKPEQESDEHTSCGHNHIHAEKPISVSQSDKANTIYTCPMHPEIGKTDQVTARFDGMALEPEAMTGDEGENPELTDMRKRFWVGLV